MRDDLLPAFEMFLLQDVILTLGNLRGSLGWLADSGREAEPAIFRAGIARLQHQIAQLEDRAHALCQDASAPCPAPQSDSRAAYAEASGLSLENLLRDALGEEAASLPPLFRSRRAALG